MVYTDERLKEKIAALIDSFENEVVEFKEARSNFSFNDIGKYFSALSNEANLRGLPEAWLIFGISDRKELVYSAKLRLGNRLGMDEDSDVEEIINCMCSISRILADKMFQYGMNFQTRSLKKDT